MKFKEVVNFFYISHHIQPLKLYMATFKFPLIVLGWFTFLTLSSSDTFSESNRDNTEGDIPKEVWPVEWFSGPQIASDVGLTTFKQSPILDTLVAH